MFDNDVVISLEDVYQQESNQQGNKKVIQVKAIGHIYYITFYSANGFSIIPSGYCV